MNPTELTAIKTRLQQRIATQFLGRSVDALPDLATEAGAALWVAWLKAEIRRRDWRWRSEWNRSMCRACIGEYDRWFFGITESAALTQAVLALMENEK